MGFLLREEYKYEGWNEDEVIWYSSMANMACGQIDMGYGKRVISNLDTYITTSNECISIQRIKCWVIGYLYFLRDSGIR